jgi:hypothetical protein
LFDKISTRVLIRLQQSIKFNRKLAERDYSSVQFKKENGKERVILGRSRPEQ